MFEYSIVATRTSSAAGEARGGKVVIPLATRPGAAAAATTTTVTAGRASGESLAPVDLLLAAIAASLLGGAEHAAEALSFRLADAEVRVRGRYEGGPSPTLAVDYDLTVATDESDARLAQFHELLRGSESVRRLGVAGTHLSGCVRRRAPVAPNAN